MSKKRTKRQKAIIKRRIFLIVAFVVVVGICVGAVSLVRVAVKNFGGDKADSSEIKIEKPKEPYVVSTATVVNTGDILVHSPVLAGAKVGDTYDFSDFFKEAKSYFTATDLAVANLEVTLGGTESGSYLGYPTFNCPDTLLDTVEDSGIDLLLTANNHCYDTGVYGLKRTVQQIKLRKALDFLGTKEAETDPTYIIKDVGGIKIGMTCFTYENKSTAAGRKSINGNLISAEANPLINSFSYENIEEFYQTAQTVIDNMKKDKADATVFYIHWGEEYQLKENTWQDTIAQKLCNMGIDVIVGGHPHVVQPIDLLTSEDSTHQTVCLYSMGNSISNQRQEIMHPECTTGHTEDGVLFYYTFQKYSDGKVVLSGVDLIPTWVNKYSGKSGYIYTMYPLEKQNDGAEKYGLTGSAATKSAASFNRTKEILGAKLTEIQQNLGCTVRFAE